MKNLSNSLSLNKRTIQILDDRNLADIKGGGAGVTCKYESCQVNTCWENSCKKAADAQIGS